MDEGLLISLGLSQADIKIYKAVRKTGEIAPTDLAKAVGVKRTTAYSMARGLVEKGFLLEDGTRRPRVFKLAGPEAIQEEILVEKKRSEERQSMLAKLAEDVSQANAAKSYPVPRVTFLEEGKIESFMKQQVLRWYESMNASGEWTWWGFQDPTFVEHFKDWIDYAWDSAPEAMNLKLLTNLAPAEREIRAKYSRRSVKYWGEAANFKSTTWVCGDYVIMINTRQQPFYLVEIHSVPLAHDQREVFRNLWEMV